MKTGMFFTIIGRKFERGGIIEFRKDRGMSDIEEILKSFVSFLEDCGEDAFYVFDNPDDAIRRFLNQQ